MTTEIVQYLNMDALPLEERVERVKKQFPKLDSIGPHELQAFLYDYLIGTGATHRAALTNSNRMVAIMRKNKLSLPHMAAARDSEIFIVQGRKRIPGWGQGFTTTLANFFADDINKIGK